MMMGIVGTANIIFHRMDTRSFAFERSIIVLFVAATAHTDAFYTSLKVPRLGHTLSTSLTKDDYSFPLREEMVQCDKRREIIEQSTSMTGSILLFPFQISVAAETDTSQQQSTTAYVSPEKEKFRYTITPPPSFTVSSKPLKTHLDEINFSDPNQKGYSLGITVDPVRIKSIREFGTPEEVAARVVTAEVNRDGVFRVTLTKDPTEDADARGCYDIEYTSEGKRGIKRFVSRIYIEDGFLYVLTVQSRESEFDTMREKEVLSCIKSFKPV